MDAFNNEKQLQEELRLEEQYSDYLLEQNIRLRTALLVVLALMVFSLLWIGSLL